MTIKPENNHLAKRNSNLSDIIFKLLKIYYFNSKLALLKVDCHPSPLGHRFPSQRVTTSVCEKLQTPSSCSDELTSSAVSSIESTLEKNETENVIKEEIICRNAANGTPRTWKDWLKDPAFYKVFDSNFHIFHRIRKCFFLQFVKSL